LRGDQLGLSRRQSDNRFDARGEGRRINAQLSRLDERFEAIENEIRSIRMNCRIRGQKRIDEYATWRPKYSLFIAFRRALVVYFGARIALLILNLYSPVVSGVFLSSVFASALAIATLLYFRDSIDPFPGVGASLMDGASPQEMYDENLREFMTAEDATEYDDSEEDDSRESEEAEKHLSPYEVLAVSEDASQKEIMAAYHQLIKQYHPDYQQQRGSKLRDLAERESQLLNWAKEEALKRF
jgi:DnaJ domain